MNVVDGAGLLGRLGVPGWFCVNENKETEIRAMKLLIKEEERL